ncbi:hypothetical protein RM780_14315 [Streptomyces sp. DSM 44917]|uniref:Uncharacterized protein n=1 Tax=Streptomyces boetiae TaxID=3075541 RepID=A0ABU2LA23_9ACTN|nr:hypothetical protein [Streptomyces sp. DSM 44917]MDT0308128.1 hypothetical protein [Streptomyces sp. DSM 44917]
MIGSPLAGMTATDAGRLIVTYGSPRGILPGRSAILPPGQEAGRASRVSRSSAAT